MHESNGNCVGYKCYEHTTFVEASVWEQWTKMSINIIYKKKVANFKYKMRTLKKCSENFK